MRQALEGLYRVALERVDPERCVAQKVSVASGATTIGGHALPDGSRVWLLAAGKAAAPMARALESALGDRLARGLVVTKDGHGLPPGRLALRETGHPVPDPRSQAAGLEALALASRVPPQDVLVIALSGGASSLWSCPLAGLEMPDVAETTRLLLQAGASIDELNAVRKHLTALSGGRLARRARAGWVVVLILSDVVGDAPSTIASGPCSADSTTYADALEIMERYRILEAAPARVRVHLKAGAAGDREESVKPGDPALRRVVVTSVGRNRDALAAAERAAYRRGLKPYLVTGAMRGEASQAGRRLAWLARAARPAAGQAARLLLAGGETTVSVQGDGRGGRSQELALAAAIVLEGAPGITVLAAGTDGTDGPTGAAGAFADGDTVGRGLRAGADARDALARNDSHGFFAREGGLLSTGPTRTNVMDLVLVLVEPATGARSQPPETPTETPETPTETSEMPQSR